MSFNVRVDSLTNKNDDGPIEVPSGVSVDSGELVANGKVNITGVTTVGFLTTQNAIVGVVTANKFVGDGSGLTNIPLLATSKAYGLKLIFSDPPLRS